MIVIYAVSIGYGVVVGWVVVRKFGIVVVFIRLVFLLVVCQAAGLRNCLARLAHGASVRDPFELFRSGI